MLNALEEEVRAYVLSTLDDTVDEDDQEALDDVLESLADLLQAHSIEEPVAKIKEELMRARAEQMNASAPPVLVPVVVSAREAQASTLSQPPKPLAAAPRAAPARAADRSLANEGVGPSAAVQMGSTSGKAAQALAQGVAMLTEMVPQASPELALHVLQQHHGETEAALDFLLGAPSIDVLEEECWAAKEASRLQQQRQAAADAKNEKRRVLARNDQQIDYSAPGDELKLAPPRIPYSQSRKDAIKGPQTRYCDGEQVHVKGNPRNESKWEKKEEWDGGSSGKVYTKGKRGKGFV
jgi:hypothetical protein